MRMNLAQLFLITAAMGILFAVFQRPMREIGENGFAEVQYLAVGFYPELYLFGFEDEVFPIDAATKNRLPPPSTPTGHVFFLTSIILIGLVGHIFLAVGGIICFCNLWTKLGPEPKEPEKEDEEENKPIELAIDPNKTYVLKIDNSA